MRLTIALLLAAVSLVSAVSDYGDFPDWNEGWNKEPDPSEPCNYGDCNVETTTTRKPTTTKRSPKTPKIPKTTTLKTPKVTKTTTTSKPRSSHRDKCTAQETRKKGCLHGSECYVITFMDNRAAFCYCSPMYRGKRCEEIDGDIFVLSAGIKAAIGVSVGLIVLLFFGIVVVVYLHKTKKIRLPCVKPRPGPTVSFQNGGSDNKEAQLMIKKDNSNV